MTARRWFYLANRVILMVLLGLIYAWSIFVAPLEAEFGWNRAQTSFTFTVCISFFVLGLLSAGFLSAKIKKRTLLLCSAASMLAGFVLCSRINTLAGLYLTYGVLVGYGVGIANNVLVSATVRWFPDKSGLASGILMMGFGMGGLILSPIAVRLIGMEAFGWRNTFLLFGVTFAVVMALGSISLKEPGPDFVAPPIKKAARVQEGGLNLPAAQVLRRSSFWIYAVWLVMLTAGGLTVMGHAASYAMDLGAAKELSAWIVGAVSLSNGIGRVITGMTYDRFGLRRSMLVTTCYLIGAALLLVLSAYTHSLELTVAGFLLTGLSYGGAPTTSSIFADSFYGKEYFAPNYALVSCGMIPGALLGPYLAGTLRTQFGGYFACFIMMLAFGCVCLVACRFLRKP